MIPIVFVYAGVGLWCFAGGFIGGTFMTLHRLKKSYPKIYERFTKRRFK